MKVRLNLEQLEARLTPAAKNVLLVIVDDQRAGTLQFMPQVMSRLVAEGTNLTNAHARTPLCCPVRAEILTGLLPCHSGVERNYPPGGGYQASVWLEGEMIQSHLQDAGWLTGFFGKYLNGWHGETVAGWDDWLGLSRIGFYNFEVTNEAGGSRTVTNEHETDLFGRKVRQFIASSEANDSQPWFAVYAPHAPHAPATPPTRYKHALDGIQRTIPPSVGEDLSDKPGVVQDAAAWYARKNHDLDRLWEKQLESLLAVDENVGLILDQIFAQGEADHTAVVYVSDNGVLLGEHGLERKRWAYTEASNVPMVLWEGWDRGPSTSDRLAALGDIFPTVMEWAGLDVHPRHPEDGESLLLPPVRDFMLIAAKPEPLAHRDGGSPTMPYRAVREESGWLYVDWKDGLDELYAANDRWQLNNLIDNPGTAADLLRLKAELASLPV